MFPGRGRESVFLIFVVDHVIHLHHLEWLQREDCAPTGAYRITTENRRSVRAQLKALAISGGYLGATQTLTRKFWEEASGTGTISDTELFGFSCAALRKPHIVDLFWIFSSTNEGRQLSQRLADKGFLKRWKTRLYLLSCVAFYLLTGLVFPLILSFRVPEGGPILGLAIAGAVFFSLFQATWIISDLTGASPAGAMGRYPLVEDPGVHIQVGFAAKDVREILTRDGERIAKYAWSHASSTTRSDLMELLHALEARINSQRLQVLRKAAQIERAASQSTWSSEYASITQNLIDDLAKGYEELASFQRMKAVAKSLLPLWQGADPVLKRIEFSVPGDDARLIVGLGLRKTLSDIRALTEKLLGVQPKQQTFDLDDVFAELTPRSSRDFY